MISQIEMTLIPKQNTLSPNKIVVLVYNMYRMKYENFIIIDPGRAELNSLKIFKTCEKRSQKMGDLHTFA